MGCSDNSGDLVDKSPQTITPMSDVNSTDGLPASHPSIDPGNTSGGGMHGTRSQAVVDGTSVKAGVLAFTIDSAWVSEPPNNAMRAAQFRLPPPDGVGSYERNRKGKLPPLRPVSSNTQNPP